MSAKPRRIPTYRLHKPTGQAVVRLDGRDHYLGKHGTEASQEAYRRLIAEWLTDPVPRPQESPARRDQCEPTVADLILAFWKFAEQHYRHADGTPTGELDNLRYALRPLRQLYGQTLARDFGPMALRAVREQMIRGGLCRGVVNDRVKRIRRVFKWGVSMELLPAAVLQSLQAVPGLRRGRCEAREAEGVQPVPEAQVRAVLPLLPAPVRAMVELQWVTACRPEEVMSMRGIDLDVSGATWLYRPGRHKTEHQGRGRVILLGPRAQQIVKGFLKPDVQAYLFSPEDAVEALHAGRRARRQSRPTPSEQARRRKERPRKRPGPRYTRRSYRHAVVRACRKANVPVWSPLQLRHTRATEIRSRYGVEAAQVILGHARADVTQVYAERDLARAAAIMAEIG